MPEITEQEKIFADAILNGNNDVDATIMAGYSAVDNLARERQASFLLSNVNIIEYMKDKERIPPDPVPRYEIISYDFKLKTLKEILENAISKLKSSDGFYKEVSAFSKIAIDTIRLTNEMQGHVSADKLITANLEVKEDSDIKKVNATLQDLTRKYDRGF